MTRRLTLLFAIAAGVRSEPGTTPSRRWQISAPPSECRGPDRLACHRHPNSATRSASSFVVPLGDTADRRWLVLLIMAASAVALLTVVATCAPRPRRCPACWSTAAKYSNDRADHRSSTSLPHTQRASATLAEALAVTLQAGVSFGRGLIRTATGRVPNSCPIWHATAVAHGQSGSAFFFASKETS